MDISLEVTSILVVILIFRREENEDIQGLAKQLQAYLGSAGSFRPKERLVHSLRG